jgi:hypothetical protein
MEPKFGNGIANGSRRENRFGLQFNHDDDDRDVNDDGEQSENR